MLIQPLPMFAPQRSRETARAADPSFRLRERYDAVRPGSGPTSIAALSSLPTLLAIQEFAPSASEQRRRIIRRGERLLDALGGLQMAMLGQGDLAACLAQMRATLREDAAVTADSELAAVLEQIELRAEVEIAKHAQNG